LVYRDVSEAFYGSSIVVIRFDSGGQYEEAEIDVADLWKKKARWRALSLIGVLLMTSGCAPIEVRERQQLDAALTTAKGESVSKMTSELTLRGYTCSAPKGAAAGETVSQCSKQRSNVFPPYTCVFRVDVEPGATGGSNAATSTVLTPSCAGL
jgi:hypothetical protein